jgi:hypothetical protein
MENALAYGAGFNSNGGGIYALVWKSSVIQVHFFLRDAIPNSIVSVKDSIDVSSWGTPAASFSGNGCDIDLHFKNHQIIFDTTFCGDAINPSWPSSSCSSLAPTCQDYVANAPKGTFDEAFWLINSVKVYQDSPSPI